MKFVITVNVLFLTFNFRTHQMIVNGTSLIVAHTRNTKPLNPNPSVDSYKVLKSMTPINCETTPVMP